MSAEQKNLQRLSDDYQTLQTGPFPPPPFHQKKAAQLTPPSNRTPIQHRRPTETRIPTAGEPQRAKSPHFFLTRLFPRSQSQKTFRPPPNPGSVCSSIVREKIGIRRSGLGRERVQTGRSRASEARPQRGRAGRGREVGLHPEGNVRDFPPLPPPSGYFPFSIKRDTEPRATREC